MRKTPLILILVLALSTSGCVFRANIPQGNVIEQDDVDQLEVGMTRNQVRFLLGTPMVDDPFQRDRWDYVYYIKVGRQGTIGKKWVTIIFADGRVSEIREDQELEETL
ncbi:MAG: outer membrane protein assembly factor BamE [Pseudomonadota bacterium]